MLGQTNKNFQCDTPNAFIIPCDIFLPFFFYNQFLTSYFMLLGGSIFGTFKSIWK